MTYCLAIKLDEAIVYLSDSRTNAGVDQLSTYSKMYSWGEAGDRQFTLLSAGNLATTQSVVTRIKRDLADAAEESLNSARYMSEAADYLGRLSVEERTRYSDEGANAGFNPEATFLLGGQIKGEEPELYLIYPQGNYISASSIRPHLQIGEIKYGKPILDRIIRPETDVDAAVRCALVSMDSTLRSNATVGPPVELSVYRKDSLVKGFYRCYRSDDAHLLDLRKAWGDKLEQAFNDLSSLDIGYP